MRVALKHVEKKQGLMFGRTLYGVECTVTFSEEELQIIEERQLKYHFIMEREASADINEEKHESRGLGRKILSAAISGKDANTHDLTFNKLMRGPETYYMRNIAEAKFYEEDLKEALKTAKKLLEFSADKAEDNTFEL